MKGLIIDTHAHTQDGIGWLSGGYVPAGRMVEIMDENGVKEAWVSATTGLQRDFIESNRRQYEETKGYPGRFVNFYAANPNYPELLEADVRRSIEDRGFRGIKMHPWMTGFAIDIPESRRMVELAIEYDVPIMYHDGTPPWSETLQVAAMADYYPEAKIIIGHAGLFDAYRSAIRACNTHDNIWLGICGPCVGDAAQIIREARTDRIVFGSDFAASNTGNLMEERLKVLELACPDEEIRRKILCENARQLIAEPCGA